MIKRRVLGFTMVVATFGVAAFSGCSSGTTTEAPVDGGTTTPVDSGKGGTPGCTPSTAQCVNASLARVCPADGSGWLAEPCAAGETCSGGGVCAGAAPCTAGATQCVNAKIAEVCNATGAWLATACNSGQTCTDGVCSGPDGGTMPVCPANTKRCVNSTLAEVCPSDGSAWIGVACPTGETCTNGVCAGDGGTACPANAQECVSGTLARVCPADGSGWLAVQCQDGEGCVNGNCVFLTDAPCEPGTGGCISTTSGLVCNAAGTSYDIVNCPANTTCEGEGTCVGAVPVGASQCTSVTTIATSPDGFTYNQSSCPTGTFCVTTGTGTAACLAGNCTPDITGNGCDTVCGNKVNAMANQTDYTSTCVATPNGYTWVAVMCPAPATCDPMGTFCGYQYTPAPACSSTCTPTATRCDPDGSGVQTCSAAGAWGNAVACNASQGLVCSTTPTGTAACGDPVCFAGTGTCTPTGLFQACTPQFTLEPVGSATACMAGETCQTEHLYPVAGAYQPGACAQVCVPGSAQCSGTGVSTCTADGVWGPETSCHGSTTCQQYTASDGNPAAVCGVCVPGTHECSGGTYGNSDIQTCSASGAWGTATACIVGTCQTTGTDFACLPTCVPGSTVCSPDGTGTGTCTAAGNAPTHFTTCAGGKSCRLDASGTALGCIQCLGPDHGLAADSECTTQKAGVPGSTHVDVCGPNDTWLPPTNCGPDAECSDGAVQACETFGQAYIDVGNPAELVTQSNIAALVPGAGCQNLPYGYYGYSSPAPCGSTPDCCLGFCSFAFAPVCRGIGESTTGFHSGGFSSETGFSGSDTGFSGGGGTEISGGTASGVGSVSSVGSSNSVSEVSGGSASSPTSTSSSSGT